MAGSSQRPSFEVLNNICVFFRVCLCHICVFFRVCLCLCDVRTDEVGREGEPSILSLLQQLQQAYYSMVAAVAVGLRPYEIGIEGALFLGSV
jgi:hypothetical protein